MRYARLLWLDFWYQCTPWGRRAYRILEDAADIRDAEIAMREIEEGRGIPWEDVKRELGL